jgi:hypothetical protein
VEELKYIRNMRAQSERGWTTNILMNGTDIEIRQLPLFNNLHDIDEYYDYIDHYRFRDMTWYDLKTRLGKPWRLDILFHQFFDVNLNLNIKLELNVYELISCNEHITWNFVKSQLDKLWRFDLLSMNAIITYDIIKQYPHVPWNYSTLSCNPNITWEIIQANPGKPWDYGMLSRNPNITWEIVTNYPEKPWDYYALSRNTMNYTGNTQLSYVLK